MNRRGKPSIHTIHLTGAELDWLIPTIRRKADQISKMPDANRRLKQLMIKFDEKLEVPPKESKEPGQFPLPTNRNEVHVIFEIAKNEHASLVATVIPGYQGKIDNAKTDEERTRLRGYIERASKRADVLLTLTNRLGRML